MQIENININELKKYEKNARTHPQKQIDLLAKNIERFGFTTPVLIDKNNEVIAGHGRLLAIKQLNRTEVPCVRMENLSQEEVKVLRLADNQITAMSEFDMDLVIEELQGLDDNLFELTGFDKDLLIEPDAEDDSVPEVPDEPKSKMGDIYELPTGNGKLHRIMVGDSTKREDVEKLMDGAKADCVFTDPPYGIDYSGGRTQVVKKKTYGKLENDKLVGEDLGNLILEVFNFNKSEADIYICVSPIKQKAFLDIIDKLNKKIDAVIVWDKKNAGLGYMAYRRQTEFILFIKGGKFKKGDKSDFDLWSIGKDLTTNYLHGTQKPVALSSRAITNSSKRDDIVLDLFLGSGSTMIACEKTNRICFGCEIDCHYIDVCVSRYCKYVGNNKVVLNGKEIEWKV